MTNVTPAPASPAPSASPPLAALLTEAEAGAAGLRLRVSAGGGLVVSGQPSPILLSRLRANKAALLELLRSTPSTSGAAP